MEAEDRSTPRGLNEVMAALADKPHAFSFFQAVRLLEQTQPEGPRLGQSQRLADDSVRLGQEVALDFATASLTRFTPGAPGGPAPRLKVRFFGLTGPNGPLPLHLSEYIHERSHRPQATADRTLEDFLDIFHHRLLSLFYRAWAEAQPVVSAERPDDDHFADWVAALGGMGQPADRARDSVPDHAKLAAVSGLSRQVRNAQGLALLLTRFFEVPAQVQDWHPQWMQLPADARTRLGDPGSAGLGQSAVLGAKVWDVQSNFLVVLGPLSRPQFQRFLPGQPGLQRLRDWVLNYIGPSMGCRLRLVLRREDLPAARLGAPSGLGSLGSLGSRLGHNTWLAPPAQGPDAADVELALV